WGDAPPSTPPTAESLRKRDDFSAIDRCHLWQHTHCRIAQEMHGSVRVEEVRAPRVKAPEMELVAVIAEDTRLEERGRVRWKGRKVSVRHKRRTRGALFISVASVRCKYNVSRSIIFHVHTGKPPAKILVFARRALTHH